MSTPLVQGLGGRATKRQIVCYISPDYNERLYMYCLDNDLTRQELLGKAINNALAGLGITTRLNVETKRIVRRPSRKRSVRIGKEHFNREGKTALAGWYPKSGVDAVIKDISRKDTNFQELAMIGLNMLCPMEDEMLRSPVTNEGESNP